MGKRIISQARGHGSMTYQVRKKAYIYKIKYPMTEGEAEIIDIIHSAAHSAPLAKIKVDKESLKLFSMLEKMFSTLKDAYVKQDASIVEALHEEGNRLVYEESKKILSEKDVLFRYYSKKQDD